MNNYSKFGVTESFWNSISNSEKELFEKINPFLKEEDSYYNVKADSLKVEIERIKNDAESLGGSFNLIPEYQRDDNQWTKEQQISFVENLIRNIAPVELKFNVDKNENVTCIDGVQRITAIIGFINGDFLVFGDLSLDDLSKTRFSLARRNLTFKLYSFKEKIDLYHFYIKLNEGGTVHAKKDIDKVKEMIRKIEKQ